MSKKKFGEIDLHVYYFSKIDLTEFLSENVATAIYGQKCRQIN